MQRIGTTNDGGALIAFTAEETSRVVPALDLLCGLAACATPTAAAAPVRDAGASIRTVTPRGRRPAAQVSNGKKTCTACLQEKPVGEFYERQARCKPCLLAAQKASKAARAGKAITTAPTSAKAPAADPATKTCTRCKQERPNSSFGPWQRVCNDCKSDGVLNRAARPTPTREERRQMISEAARRIREREDADIPREGGRALPVGSSD